MDIVQIDAEEKNIYNNKIPLKAFLFSRSLLFVLILGWNIGLLWAFWKKMTTKLKITSQRIVLIKGLVAQDEEEIEYYRIKGSKFKQNIMGRIFNVGKITIWSDDTTAPLFSFELKAPKTYREKIRKYVLNERKRMKSIQLD